jgi:Na+/H+ antiporter NhaD/arsenite permease-like protein
LQYVDPSKRQETSVSTVVAISIFTLGYVLIATEKIHRVTVVLAGAGLLLALRIMDTHDAFHSEEYGVDWNVVFLLLGMMLIVGAIQQTGLFDYLALWAVRLTTGQPFRLMATLVLITAIASALVDNVTTVLLVAPMTIAITRDLGLRAAPFLMSEAFASNIGGTATLIGDPPNIIIGSRAGLSYVEFLTNLGPVVLVLLGAYLALCRVMFRAEFSSDLARVAAVTRQDPRAKITDTRMLRWSLATLGVVTVGFVLHSSLHYEPSVIALLGGGVLLLVSPDRPSVLHEVEWATLAFFAGLFVMVGALVKVGAIQHLADALANRMDGNLLGGSLLLLGASAVLSAVVDNIPYVATMTPVVSTLANDLPPGTDPNPLWWSLALGADLGGNATPIGASANIVILAIAAKSGERITFGQFVRYGSIVTATTLAIASLYVWLRYFALT